MPKPLAAAFTSALLVAGVAALDASAQDVPKRKPGLWQHNMTTIGAPMPPTSVTMCTDERMDKMLADRSEAERCSKQSVRREGNAVVVEAVCTQQNTTVRTKGRFSGDFNSHYTGEMHSTFDPPMHGMKETRQKIEAKWLGPCKPGQKPGDVQVQGMGGMNVHEMMKGMDKQQMQEMMKGMDPKQKQEMMQQMQQMQGTPPR
jgi:hypothetical protein